MTIFSIILGGGSVYVELNVFRISLSAILIVLGIMSIKSLMAYKEVKRLVKALLVVWFFSIIGTLLVMYLTVLGVIMFLIELGVMLVPIVYGFKYLSYLKHQSEKPKVSDEESHYFKNKTSDESNEAVVE